MIADLKIYLKSVIYPYTLKIVILITACIVSFLLVPITGGESRDAKENLPALDVPILLYHRFGPVVSDSMTMNTAVFESHLKYIACGSPRARLRLRSKATSR